jgi:hypothetical protein
MVPISVPVLHVGIHKTATTSLQQAFFPNHPDIDYLGRMYANPDISDLIHSIYRKDAIEFTDRDLDAHRGTLEVRRRLDGRRVVAISEEFLSGDTYADRGVIARRLLRVFGPSKVVITIRNQLAIVVSEYVDRARSREYVGFDRWVRHGIDNWHASSLRLYDYARLAKFYADLMGSENVGIFLFEEFVADNASFFDKLCKFMGVGNEGVVPRFAGLHANPTKSSRLLNYKKLRAVFGTTVHFSRLVPRMVNERFQGFLTRGPAARIVPLPATVRILERTYAESNKRLADTFYLPLAKYGYPLPECSAPSGQRNVQIENG